MSKAEARGPVVILCAVGNLKSRLTFACISVLHFSALHVVALIFAVLLAALFLSLADCPPPSPLTLPPFPSLPCLLTSCPSSPVCAHASAYLGAPVA